MFKNAQKYDVDHVIRNNFRDKCTNTVSLNIFLCSGLHTIFAQSECYIYALTMAIIKYLEHYQKVIKFWCSQTSTSDIRVLIS